MMKCKNCGFEFEGKFCPECGTKAELPASTAAAVEQATEKPIAAEQPVADAAPDAAEQPEAVGEQKVEEQTAPEAPQNAQAGAIPVMPAGEIQYVYVPDGKGGFIAVAAGGAVIPPIAPVQPVAPPTPKKVREPRPKGSGIAAFKEIVGKVVGKADEKGLLTRSYRYLPAGVSLFYGFLILIFMACSGATAFGMTMGSVYDLISEPGGAAGPVALIIIAIDFLLCGALKAYWAVKFPYYKSVVLNVVQNVLFFFAFIFSCVTVGYGNSVASAGAGGALILTFTLLGAFFPIAGALLFRFGFLDGIKERQSEAAEAFKAYWAERKANKPVRVGGVAVGAAGASAKPVDNVVYTKTIAVSADSCEDLSPTRFVKSRLYRPAFACLFTALLMSLWFVVRPDSFNITGGNSSQGSMKLMATAWVLICIISLTLSGIVRAITAYKNPYEKHPALFMANIAAIVIFPAMSGLYMGMSAINAAVPETKDIVFTVVSAAVMLFLLVDCAYECMKANTFKYRAKIKAARAVALASPQKMPVWKRVVVGVMALGVVALCAVPPIIETTNKFTASKVSKVEIGMSYDEVIGILGKPYKEESLGGKTLEYYSGNYVSVMGKETNADDIGSLDDLENALEQELKKEEKLANMVFKGIQITLNADDKVTGVILDTQLKVKDPIKKSSPAYDDVKVSVSERLKDANGKGVLVYSVTYPDGSYESAPLSSYEIDPDYVNSTDYRISFRPKLYNEGLKTTIQKSWVIERKEYADSNNRLEIGMSVSEVKSIMGEFYDSASISTYLKYEGADGTAEIIFRTITQKKSCLKRAVRRKRTG